MSLPHTTPQKWENHIKSVKIIAKDNQLYVDEINVIPQNPKKSPTNPKKTQQTNPIKYLYLIGGVW